MLKKGDLIVGAVIIVVILASFAGVKYYNSLGNGNEKIAVIRQNNEVINRIDLNKVTERQIIKVDGDFHNTILVENGRIRFEDADCHDLVCVKTGWIAKRGQIAVCLPNKVSVKIEGNDDNLDAVSY